MATLRVGGERATLEVLVGAGQETQEDDSD